MFNHTINSLFFCHILTLSSELLICLFVYLIHAILCILEREGFFHMRGYENYLYEDLFMIFFHIYLMDHKK